MPQILLIRHGIAEPFTMGKPDSERGLTDEGWLKTRAAMAGLVAKGHVPSRGISSPYRRALETMACLKEAALAAGGGAFPVGYSEVLTPDSDTEEARAWFERLLANAGEDEQIAFTSHEPFLSTLIRRLSGRDLDVKKASCTVLDWRGSGWRFLRHFTPAQLRGED